MGVPTIVRIVPAQGRPQREAEASRPTRLSEVLDALPHATHWTAVLGVCEDGVPYLWELRQPFSLLVTGEGLTLPWRVLDAVRVSLERHNTRGLLEITWVTERETRGGGITDAISPHERVLEQTLYRLADLVDARSHGRLRGPRQVLILDDLTQVLGIDREALWALEYLLKHGNRGDLAVLAAVDRALVARRPLSRWAERFKGVIVQDGMGFSTKQGRVATVEV